MRRRKETDSLGEKSVPAEVYYGIQTLRASENFRVSGLYSPEVFVRSYVLVKKACARVNVEVGWLEEEIGKAIVQACDEVLAGGFMDQFVVDVFQAGAGTSFNMNVNEVLSNRTLEIMGKSKGDYESVSPNDHVNMGQSSNDTFPTALHIATLTSLQKLLQELDSLADAFYTFSRKYARAIKSGRTHLQDALPVTLGQEFGAYGTSIKNLRQTLSTRSRLLLEVALGGTAVGSGVNAHPSFAKKTVAELGQLTHLKLIQAKNPFEALQSRRALAAVSSGLKELAIELIRISNDLRLLSSGPTTGLGEISLPPVQPGSSIMPGKINPVMAECLDMICFQVLGNDLAVALAAQAGQLELNVMTPVMMHNILQSIQLLSNYLPTFREKCVQGIVADETRCARYVDKNPSLAVFLSPYIGHLKASKLAQQALKEGRSVKEIVLEQELLHPEEVERIFSREYLLGKKRLQQQEK